MVTMVTHPFCESMGPRVTYMGAHHPHKYTTCIPHRRNRHTLKFCFIKCIIQQLTWNPKKKSMGAVNVSFIAIWGPTPKCFYKPGRKARWRRSSSGPSPIAMSSILRGLKTRHREKLPSFGGKSHFCEGGAREVLEKWACCSPPGGQISYHSHYGADSLVSLSYNNSLTRTKWISFGYFYRS